MAEAEGVLRRAASLPGANATVNFNLGAFLFQKGMTSLRQRDSVGMRTALDEARVWLERAVRQEPNHVKALLLVGNCYHSEGRDDEARRAWTRVVEIDGAQGIIGREAANFLARLGAGS
jgi:Tfp pilus assembly protein PilF